MTSFNAPTRVVFAKPQSAALFILDLVALITAWALSTHLLHALGDSAQVTAASVVALLLMVPLGLALSGLYHHSLAVTPRDELYFAGVGAALGIVMDGALQTIFQPLHMQPLAMLTTGLCAIGCVGCERGLIHAVALSRYNMRRGELAPASVNRQGTRLRHPVGATAKRAFDVVASGVLLFAASPIFLLAGLLIVLDDGQPIFFRQKRIGIDGRPFTMFKFRTMKRDSGAKWAETGDPRVTRVGRLLRRFSIDELPQLLNVFKGEMSLVGPRPEMEEYESRFARHVNDYVDRRRAPPGITGFAQISLPRLISPDDVGVVLDYDLFYIENWCLSFDFAILLKTICEFPFQRTV